MNNKQMKALLRNIDKQILAMEESEKTMGWDVKFILEPLRLQRSTLTDKIGRKSNS